MANGDAVWQGTDKRVGATADAQNDEAEKFKPEI
jgi:hypothetical protein